jgi:hypothetical protein
MARTPSGNIRRKETFAGVSEGFFINATSGVGRLARAMPQSKPNDSILTVFASPLAGAAPPENGDKITMHAIKYDNGVVIEMRLRVFNRVESVIPTWF